MMKRIVYVFLLLAVSVSVLMAQSARENLSSALKTYNKRHYQEAAEMFGKLYREMPPEVNPYASVELFMLIKSTVRLNKDQECLEYCVEFMDRFEFSRYTEHVLFIRANILIEENDFPAAMAALLESLDYSSSDMDGRIRDLAREVSRYFLTREQLSGCLAFQKKSENVVFYKLLLADRLLRDGERGLAEQALRSIRSTVKKHYDSLMFNELVKTYQSETQQKEIDLGVVLPLSGESAENGQAILQGLKFAVEQYKNHSDLRFNLLIRDNRGELLESVRAARYLAKIPSVAAIIGPLNSKNAVAMTSVCDLYHLPLLAPTASIRELTELGNTVYQFNTNQYERAKTLAEFAMDSLGLKTFATLAPSDDYGRASTEGFISTVEAKGGEVVYMGWYSGTPLDLKIQYHEMRDIAFNILESDTLDTNNVLLDSTLVLKTSNDSLRIKLSTIDGLYLPIYQDDIKYVTSGIAYWNFDLQLLGDGAFYSQDVLDKYRRYDDGVIFSTNYYINESSPEYQDLSRKFTDMTGDNINMLNIYGYEMIAFLLNASRNKAFTRADLMSRLQDVQAYRGLIRNIQFNPGEEHTNSGVRIIRYKSGQMTELN